MAIEAAAVIAPRTCLPPKTQTAGLKAGLACRNFHSHGRVDVAKIAAAVISFRSASAFDHDGGVEHERRPARRHDDDAHGPDAGLTDINPVDVPGSVRSAGGG